MNNHGYIVGSAENANGALMGFLNTTGNRSFPIRLYDLLHADYKLDATQDQDGWRSLSPNAINDAGQIVGHGGYTELPSTHSTRGFLMTWDEVEGFYHIKDLGMVTAAAINVQGDVSGTFDTDNGTRAFLLPAGDDEPIDLGVLSGGHNFSTAKAVNASGQVASYSGLNPGEFSAFLLTPDSGMQDLGVLRPQRGGYEQGFAYALNDSGVVVGTASAGGWQSRAFRWDGSLKDLGTFGGDDSEGRAINNSGNVVGWASDNLYVDGVGLLRLADFTDLPGITISNWSRNDITITDNLVIMGNLRGPSDVLQAFVLTPVEL
jgi:probable HAF family extracellular repeat protein